MKVLSIGNSFSQDAHAWLNTIALRSGVDMLNVNLYYGGCSLERHIRFYDENTAAYDLEINGGNGERKAALFQALAMDKWDIITLQQVSTQSGISQSYIPYLTQLTAIVKAAQPQAELFFHQTWAYEQDFSHEGFLNYSCSQQKMFCRICDCSKMAARLIDAKIIPAGSVIQALREELSEFDYAKGGLSLCRDGYHLSKDYGRFAAAATWFYTFTGIKPEASAFEELDSVITEKILKTVYSVADKYK